MNAIWIAMITVSSLSLFFGGLLGYASRRFQTESDPITEQIDALLPQSQCGQCGYIGCRPYAEAIANGAEAINKCVPGGEKTMQKLAALLNVAPQPVDEVKQASFPVNMLAWIDEASCIGCTKCIKACPVDAIVGASRVLHTVLSELCTGCTLCVAPCPMDCIYMHPVPVSATDWNWDLNSIPVQNIAVDGHG